MKFIIALAIYQETGKEEKPFDVFHEKIREDDRTPLLRVEKESLKRFLKKDDEEKVQREIRCFRIDTEFHFFKRIRFSPEKLIVICSQRKLSEVELERVLSRIEYLFVNEERLKERLEGLFNTIFINLLQFTSSPILEATLAKAEEVKGLAKKNVVKILDNSLRIECLDDKSQILEDQSKTFLRQSKEENSNGSCCGW